MGSTSIGTLAIFHDAAYINARVAEAWRRAMVSVTLQTLLIVAVTQLTIRWGLGQPLKTHVEWLRELRAGDGGAAPKMPEGGEFEPFTHEISRLASSFHCGEGGRKRKKRAYAIQPIRTGPRTGSGVFVQGPPGQQPVGDGFQPGAV
jgi:hypothetical protein